MDPLPFLSDLRSYNEITLELSFFPFVVSSLGKQQHPGQSINGIVQLGHQYHDNQ
jgi:hypothetical protein